MKNQDLITKAIGLLPAYDRTPNEQKIFEHLQAFLLSNALAESCKLNLYDYVSTDDLRPAQTGICFDKGRKIATNAHILVCMADSYDPEFEGRIINKKGTDILDCKFPNYMAVKPQTHTKSVVLNFDRIAEIAKEAKLHVKLGEDGTPAICIDDVYFAPAYLHKLAIFAKHIGATEIQLREPGRAGVVENGDSWGLLMPLMYNDGLKVFQM